MNVVLAVLAGALAGLGAGELVAVWAGRGRSSGAARRPTLVGLARAVAPGVARWVPMPTDAARRIDAAGLAPTLTVADLRALRGAGVVVGGVLGLAVLSVIGASAIVLVAAIPVALALVPDLIVRRRTALRAATILRALPDAIDLLRIVLGGGRSVPEALGRVGAHQHGVLGHELRRTAAEVRLGVPVEVALVGLRRRCPADGAAELTALLLRAHGHGATVTDGLQALADDLRDRRAREAIDRAARAAPKIQLVVALLLVPAAMLLIAAALLQLR